MHSLTFLFSLLFSAFSLDEQKGYFYSEIEKQAHHVRASQIGIYPNTNITGRLESYLKDKESVEIIFDNGIYYLDSMNIYGKKVKIIGERNCIWRKTGIKAENFIKIRSRSLTLFNLILQDFDKESNSTGLYIYNSEKVTVENLRILDFKGKGIDVLFSNNIIIKSNIINNALHGIQVWAGDANIPAKDFLSKNIVIQNNKIYNVKSGGIWCSRCCDVSILNNFVKNCGDVGIDYERCINSTIIRNRVYDCQNGGITLFFACSNILIEHNLVKQNNRFGPQIHIYKWYSPNKNIIIRDNYFYGERGISIFAEEYSADSLLIEKNIFRGKVDKGLHFIDANNISVINNSFKYDNCNIAIFNEGGSDWLISWNAIRAKRQNSHTTYGIYNYWRSNKYPAQNNLVERNNIINYTVSILDNSWGDFGKRPNIYRGNKIDNLYSNYYPIISNNKIMRNKPIANMIKFDKQMFRNRVGDSL